MSIQNLSYIILFVQDPLQSADFYSKLLNLKPLETGPTFSLFALPYGLMLGLWNRKTAEPIVEANAGSSEIAFTENNVDEIYERWVDSGIAIAQVPTDMDFGRTFVALDPDGHRIRVFRPETR